MAKLSSSNGIAKFPKLRFPEFKEPWNLVKLEDVCSYRKDRTKVKKAQYVSTENILQNYAGIEPYDDLTETEGISIQFGDTLMANIRPYLRKVWQSKFDGACSTDVLAFSPDNIDGNFLYFLIAQDRFVNYVMCGAKGSKMPRGDKKHILEYETGVPTESEQRKIAHFIDLLNARISSQNSLINLIKKYKRGALSALFPKKGEITPQYRFAGFTKPWEQRKLGNVVQVERGGSPRPIDDYITDSQNGLNWVKIGDAPAQGHYITKTAEKIKPEGLSKTREVHPGDLILSNSMSFGKPYIMGIDGCIHDGWLLIRDINNTFDLTFLCHLLGTPQMLDQYRSLASGSTVNNLNKELVGNTVVTIPKIDEQRVLGQYLERLDNLITLHQHKCYSLLSLKNALLQQMFI